MTEAPRVTGLQIDQDPSDRPIRVAVIGARRVRNGTGPFLARQVADAGGQLVAVLGTTPATAGAARDDLAEDGYECEAFTSLEMLISQTDPDALVVATPAGTHRPWLESAVHHELHVLCEKPLLTVFQEEAARIPARFAAQGRVLMENCQWPQTLPSFRELHPSCKFEEVTRFRMMLSPEFRGLSRWIETLSHPLSLLQAVVAGPAELSKIRFAESGPAAPDARLSFVYTALGRSIDCEVRLQDTGERPRPAEFAFDDFVARRRVEGPDYQIYLDDGYLPEGEGEPRRVAIPDPQRQTVEQFLGAIHASRSAGSARTDEAISRRQRLLSELLSAYSSSCNA